MSAASKVWKLAVIGGPDVEEYSLSPCMHKAVLGAAGNYRAIGLKSAEELEQWLQTEAPKLDGFNVTMPYKEAVYEWMAKNPERASLDKVPEEIRAVNTVKSEPGKLAGYNTDRQGFVGPLKERKGQDCLKGKRVLLLGAGGAAQAIALNVIVYGASSLEIWNRNIQRAKLLVEGFKKNWAGRCNISVRENAQGSLSDIDLVVNATSAGMAKSDELLISTDSLEKRHWVYDIVYQPKETKLIQVANQRHCQVVVLGYEMLAHQGAESLEIWTEKNAVGGRQYVEIMKQALNEHFAKHAS
jgi:shikimate dehydrogenase